VTSPRVTFGDAERLLIDYLTAQYAPRAEAYKPTTIATDFPTVALAGNATHLQVELEASVMTGYPVAERAQVRITCWAAPTKRTNVKALASLTGALLYAHPGSSSIAGTSPLIGRSSVSTDDTTKNVAVWFLARVNLKATLLAS
jgi:hypothetical protein